MSNTIVPIDFTATERRMLPLLADNLASKEIAVLLDMAVATVNTHRKNMARKLGAKGKTEFRQAIHRLKRAGEIPE